jgi:small-conductance mechanosensitive channel
MPFWQRIVIAAGVFLLVWILSRVVDWWLKRRGPLAPEMQTRYLVLRRAVSATILVVGFLSALLVIPQVRAIAGGLLASSAVLGIIIGLASQQVLGNFMAGLVIALTQPVRIGDRVAYASEEGTVEEIGLTYTFIRTLDRQRLVVPNSKLASDTIVNSSIRSRETFAAVRVALPLSTDVGAALDALRGEVGAEHDAEVYLDSLDSTANVVVRVLADDEVAAERLERDLRLRVHRRLRELGVWPG